MTIVNAKIVTSKKIINGNIIINRYGKITAITKTLYLHPKGVKESFDAKGRYVLPGLIEVHGHMREPGMAEKEDVPHGTRAAIAGGFTTIIDMPNTNPPTTTVRLLEEKMNKIYAKRSYADYSFFMGVDKDNIGELEKVNPYDVAGIKVFMAGHETTPTTITDDQTLEKIIKIASRRKILLAVHAEDQGLIDRLTKKYKNTNNTSPQLWSKLRSKEVVIKAVRRIITIAKKHKVKLYLLHLSTPEEFEIIKRAKKKGLSVYSELVSYQLLFNTTDYKRLGNKIKVAPALRSSKDQNAMWKIFRNRQVDVICSEHTPHELKPKLQKNVFEAPAGMPNIQETLPSLITAWVKRYGKNTIEECLMTIACLASYNPAKIFQFTTKGEIKPGKDADLVVLDIDNLWTVKKEDLFSKCGWSAYVGEKLIGFPVATFLRGELIYKI